MTGKIVEVETVALQVPLRKPTPMTWFTTMSTRENVLVRLRTDDGLEGFGDAVTAPYFTGETALGAKALIERDMAPAIIGLRPLDLTVAADRLARIAGAAPAARAAVDIALHDLAAKSLDVPLTYLLGGPVQERLPGTWHLFNLDTEVDCAEAREAVATGYRRLKVKVGKGAVEADIARLRAIRDAVGDGVSLSVDANEAWRSHDAIHFCRLAREVGVSLVEQPVAKEDLPGMAAVVAAGAPAVAADEGVRSAADLVAHARIRAADAVVVKLIKSGGLSGARRLIAVADASGVDVYVAGMGGETSVAGAAAVHLAVATGRLPFGVALAPHYIAEDIVERPVAPEGGTFYPLAGPGLGVDVNMDAVREHRLHESV